MRKLCAVFFLIILLGALTWSMADIQNYLHGDNVQEVFIETVYGTSSYKPTLLPKKSNFVDFKGERGQIKDVEVDHELFGQMVAQGIFQGKKIFIRYVLHKKTEGGKIVERRILISWQLAQNMDITTK